jgi:pimeloyl-ACP methyl ester carboxylesterase
MTPATRAPSLIALAALFAASPGSAQTSLADAEGLRGVTVQEGIAVTEAGLRVRTYLSRPAGSRGRLPAVLFVQWLSCDPVRLRPGARDGWTTMLRGLIERSGMVVMRTEKPGLGGSEGPPCSSLDYETDLSAHRAALRALLASPEIATDSVFVFGASMGGTMAPLLARDAPVRGVMVWGATGYPWKEHLRRLDRRVLSFRGMAPAEIERRMPLHDRLLTAYLDQGVAPPEIIRRAPELGPVWAEMLGTGPDHQYGRPFRFHQQAQHADWTAAWAAVRAPILIAYGDYDWLMAPEEHLRIAELVNAAAPGRAETVAVHGSDHHFELYPSVDAAFAGRGGSPNAAASDVFLRWLSRQRGNRP